MSVASLPPLTEFVELVRVTDPDAAYRMKLVNEAGPVLTAETATSQERREELADGFERWRYQLLNKNGNDLTENQRKLSQALDLTVAELLQQSRPPRNPRQALASNEGRDIESYLQSSSPLEDLIERARDITDQNFTIQSENNAGRPKRRMRLYAPLYLSSFCVNHCLYCGFRFPHAMERKHLNLKETLIQAEILGERGFRHLLLVAGDFPKMHSTAYFVEALQALVERHFTVAIEIAPQTTLSYAKLARAGACGVTLYQETYQENLYNQYHPIGPKVWFDWRLEGPERAIEAGISRIGLGILLGLADPKIDILGLIRHGRYLASRFSHIKLAFSLPRIYEAPEGFDRPFKVSDEEFIRLYCVLRLAFPSAELVLSTRERPSLRDQLAQICITQMSAGSSTVPGGYTDSAQNQHNRQQFPVVDERSPTEVVSTLEQMGLAVQWQL